MDGNFLVRKLSEQVCETVYEGFLSPGVFAASDLEYWRLSGDRAIPYAVVDGTLITGFDAQLPSSAAPALRSFRERGGREYVMVSTSGSLRMLASAIAVAEGVSFRVFDTRAEAFDHLRGVGAW